MGQEIRIECLADSADRGYPEIRPRGSMWSILLLLVFARLFRLGESKHFGGKTSLSSSAPWLHGFDLGDFLFGPLGADLGDVVRHGSPVLIRRLADLKTAEALCEAVFAWNKEILKIPLGGPSKQAEHPQPDLVNH